MSNRSRSSARCPRRRPGDAKARAVIPCRAASSTSSAAYERTCRSVAGGRYAGSASGWVTAPVYRSQVSVGRLAHFQATAVGCPANVEGRALPRRWPLGHSIRGQSDTPPTLGGQGSNLSRGEPALSAVGFDVLPGHRSGFLEGISKLSRGFLWNRHRQKADQAPAEVCDQESPAMAGTESSRSGSFRLVDRQWHVEQRLNFDEDAVPVLGSRQQVGIVGAMPPGEDVTDCQRLFAEPGHLWCHIQCPYQRQFGPGLKRHLPPQLDGFPCLGVYPGPGLRCSMLVISGA